MGIDIRHDLGVSLKAIVIDFHYLTDFVEGIGHMGPTAGANDAIPADVRPGAPMADGAKVGIGAVVEGKVRAIGTPAASPGENILFTRDGRVMDPGLHGAAVRAGHVK